MEALHLKAGMPKLDDAVFASLNVEMQTYLRDRVLLGMIVVSKARFDANYPFDETSVKQTEDFLLTLKGRVLRWGAGLEPERIITRTGLKTASKKHIDEFTNYLHVIGCFYSYCLAKITGGKFVLIDEELGVEPPEKDAHTSFAVGKVFKFLRNGEEDSLVGFLTIIRARAGMQSFLDEMLELFRSHIKEFEIELPEGSKLQYWHDSATGNLDKIAYVDADGKEICCMQFNGGIDDVDFANVSDDIIRDFATSEAGQELLQGIYSKPDENGMCKRADTLSEELQNELIRDHLSSTYGNIRPEGEPLH